MYTWIVTLSNVPFAFLRLCPVKDKFSTYFFNCFKFSHSMVIIFVFTISSITTINTNIHIVTNATTIIITITFSFIGCYHKKSHNTHRQIFNICINTHRNQVTSNNAGLTFIWTNSAVNINS